MTACANKTPISTHLNCPSVPECVRPNIAINNNGDLARAYLESNTALSQCKIARDTLQACLDQQP